MTCIYNSQRIWSTIRHYWPERAGKIAQYEQTFGVTVSRKKNRRNRFRFCCCADTD
ncbi:FIG01047316: hypothetical protein [Klebsiella pneumoniae IS39]|nr:FIG01047316: hypothetical protein [Klebsiella pneumoniae IS39]